MTRKGRAKDAPTDMLESLDNINWSNLEDAYGPASNMPGLIRALTSANRELQEEALSQIWDRIWHYGRITEATPYVIPPLIELVCGRALGENLLSVLKLLYYLGDGPTPWEREITNLKTYGEKAEGESLVLLDRERNLSREAVDGIFQQAERYIQQSHYAVCEGLPLYLDLLATSNDPAVREICAWLAVVFPERVAEIAPRLRSLIDREPDITVKATMVWSLGRLVRDLADPLYLSTFSRLARSREHPLVYFYAAAAYTCIAKTNTQPDIAALVATGIYWDWQPTYAPPPVTPGPILISRSIQLHGCRALMELGAERAVPLLIAILKRLDDSESVTTYLPFEPVIDALLALTFGSRNPNAYRVSAWLKDGKLIRAKGRYYDVEGERDAPHTPELTNLQRQVLSGLLDTERLWEYEDNVYVLYGLPMSREGLNEFLASKPTNLTQ